jgi:hypothetical protein
MKIDKRVMIVGGVVSAFLASVAGAVAYKGAKNKREQNRFRQRATQSGPMRRVVVQRASGSKDLDQPKSSPTHKEVTSHKRVNFFKIEEDDIDWAEETEVVEATATDCVQTEPSPSTADEVLEATGPGFCALCRKPIETKDRLCSGSNYMLFCSPTPLGLNLGSGKRE